MASLSGVLRQPSASTGFGHALNIGTLVAAAETRNSPIEVCFFKHFVWCLQLYRSPKAFPFLCKVLVFLASCMGLILVSLQTPSSEVQDKIAFIMNNISITNLDQKAKECLEVLKDSYHPWFAQYVVMKR